MTIARDVAAGGQAYSDPRNEGGDGDSAKDGPNGATDPPPLAGTVLTLEPSVDPTGDHMMLALQLGIALLAFAAALLLAFVR